MASVKIVLRKKPNKEAKLPLCIQIVKDRKNSLIYLGQYISPKDWDKTKQVVKKSHPNHEALNIFLLKKIMETNNRFLELETRKAHSTSKTIRNKLKSKDLSTFFSQSDFYLENLKLAGKYNRYSSEKPRINRFKEFLNGDDILFPDITVPLLNRFRAYLKGTREISERTIINHFVVIRSIFSQAIKDNIVEQKFYPFGKGKIRIKFPDSIKISLSIEEVRKMEDVELPKGSSLDHARNLWLLSFYFAGMRISDLLRLKWSDISKDRLTYKMGKNEKAGSFKISEKAAKILLQYKTKTEQTGEYIFNHLESVSNPSNLFDVQKKISNATKTIDEALQKLSLNLGINKKLTMHVARHTFGNLSGDKIPIHLLQKLYRHTSVTTTIGYQSNFTHKDTDEALDSVINFY